MAVAVAVAFVAVLGTDERSMFVLFLRRVGIFVGVGVVVVLRFVIVPKASRRYRFALLFGCVGKALVTNVEP